MAKVMVKRAVPLVPDAAGTVLDLRAPDDLEPGLAVASPQLQIERRSRLDQLGNLAVIDQPPVGAGDRAVTVLADRDQGRVDTKVHQSAATRAVGGDRAHRRAG